MPSLMPLSERADYEAKCTALVIKILWAEWERSMRKSS